MKKEEKAYKLNIKQDIQLQKLGLTTANSNNSSDKSPRKMNKQILTKISEAMTNLESGSNSSSDKITKDNMFSHIIISIFSSCFSLLCIFLMETTNLIFMGKTSEASSVNLFVDSVGLGNIYLNFIGVLIGFGILGGLDTMGSHAYGSYQFEQLGIYTIRTRIILMIIFIFFTLPLGYFSAEILLFLNIPSNLVINSSSYIFCMLPTIILTFNFNLNLRYLQVMQIYFIPSIITITALIVHIFLCYILVGIFDMAIMGLCIASTITMSYSLIVSSVYILVSNPLPQSLFIIPPSTTLDFKEFFEYLKLSIYSGAQHYGDYIGYEIVCLMCSYLEESSMAATLVVLNFANLIGYIYVGFSFPLSQQVGLFLGKRNFEMFRYCIKLYFWINFITAIILSSIFYFWAEKISFFYIEDPVAAAKASTIFTMWTIGAFSDIFNIMYQAILRGAGKQKITSIWNLVLSIFWMVPVSYTLCFVFKYDVLGIWLGCISYTVICAFINFCYVLFLDEKEASDIISKQMDKEEQKLKLSISYSKLGDEENDEGDYV